MRYLQIETLAEKLIRDAGCEGIFPVPLDRVVSHLGFSLGALDTSVTELSGVSGLINYETKSILINPDESVVRNRFTIGHELGHGVLHAEGSTKRGAIDYRNRSLPVTDEEREANWFSGAILMPATSFRAKVAELGGDTRAVATFFGVSAEAAAIRAAQFKE